MLGISARRRIAETGERGAGLAIAGIAVGIITLLIAITYWAFTAMDGGSAGYGY